MEGSRVCFIGHRKIPMTDELKVNIQTAIENLIVNDKATYFLFGSRSQFDDLCYVSFRNFSKNIRALYASLIPAEVKQRP